MYDLTAVPGRKWFLFKANESREEKHTMKEIVLRERQRVIILPISTAVFKTTKSSIIP